MTEIQITSHDGQTFNAYVAMPQAKPAAAVIMIQEIFGVNQEMRTKCDEMAAQGYLAVCPDLFWRIEPGIQLVDSVEEQLQRAFELFGLFDVKNGVKDLQATLEHIRNHDDCNGKVGAVGYCLGGKLSYMLAAQSDLDAAISYYGVGLEDMLDQASNIKKPILLHIAGNDQFVPPAAQDKIMTALADHPQAECHHYEGADHAFARHQGTHYDETAATLANGRSADFLKKYL